MTIDIASKSLKVVADRKARSYTRVPQGRSPGEETELTVKITNFNNDIIRPNCQPSIALKFMKSHYHRGKFIRTVTMKMFIEKEALL